MKEDYQKALKKLILYFLLNSVFFNGQSKTKVAWSSWPVAPQVPKHVHKKSFISYKLSEQVWCYKSGFLSYYKNDICKYMQENSWHHKLFHCHFSFWIWKVWKGTEKIQKSEYLEDARSFLDEIKNICHSCWRAIIRWKNKNLIKNNGRKL